MPVFGRFLVLAVVACLASTALSSIYNAPCNLQSECQLIYNKEYECFEGGCIRHHFEFGVLEIIGSIVIIMVSMTSNAGGVGAGTVIIPIFEVFFDFVSSEAIALSRITIFAGSLVNYLLNFHERDPKTGSHLIDYRLAAVMMPLLLAGTQVGVMLARFFPSITVTGVLVLYLISSTRQMYRRAQRDSAKETQALMNESNSKEAKEDQGPAEIKTQTDESENQTKLDKSELSIIAGDGMSTVSTEVKDEPSISTEQLNKITPINTWIQICKKTMSDRALNVSDLVSSHKHDLLSCLASFLLIVVSASLRGGEGRKSIIGLETCSTNTGAIFFVTQFLAVIFAIRNYCINKGKFEDEDKKCESPDEALMRRELRKKLLYAAYVTGILAGLLGVGGGLIMNLYMLSLGMDPYVANALSTFIVLFSSGATAIQFIIAGAIHLRHAYLFMILSFVGSLVGNLVLKAAIKKYRRPSLIIWVLFFVLAISVVVLPLEMAMSIFKSHAHAISFGNLC